MFCDVCGTKYDDGDLRATSKYCMQCGETLPKLIVDALQGQQRSSQREPNRSHIQPSTSFTPRTQPQDSPIAPFGGDEAESYGSPDTLRNEILSTGNISAPSSEYGHSPSPPPSNESSMDSDYEEPDRITSVEIESDEDDTMSIDDPSPSNMSLNLEDYGLPPPFPVPIRYNRAFPRHVIGKVLGGGLQTTYPVPGDRRNPMYACVRSNLCPTLPSQQGAHGIMITGAVPKEFPKQNFMLFVRHLNDPLWYYRGQYRIRSESKVTPQHWLGWTAEARTSRDDTTLRLAIFGRKWAKSQLRRGGLPISTENCRRIIARGGLKSDAKVLECIGFDIELYDRLYSAARY